MTVKAVQFHRFGNIDVLELAEVEPEPLKENQVRVKVAAVGLNPVDYKIFEGVKQLRMLSRIMKLRHPSKWFEKASSIFPRGVARDFAGTIIEVGENVTQFSVGDRVFGTIISAPGLGSKRGALATEICVKETEIASMPSNIDFLHGSVLGVSSLTVGGAFRKINIGNKDTIVISGASGGIGSIAVQYAVSKGVRVIGIASAGNADYLRSIGAIPISYHESIKEKIQELSGVTVTKMLDCYGGDYVKLGFQLGLRGDQIATLVPSPSAILKGAQFTGPRHSQYDDFLSLAELVSKGEISVRLDKIYPFSLPEIKEAYKDLEKGHTRGKRVIVIQEE